MKFTFKDTDEIVKTFEKVEIQEDGTPVTWKYELIRRKTKSDCRYFEKITSKRPGKKEFVQFGASGIRTFNKMINEEV